MSRLTIRTVVTLLNLAACLVVVALCPAVYGFTLMEGTAMALSAFETASLGTFHVLTFPLNVAFAGQIREGFHPEWISFVSNALGLACIVLNAFLWGWVVDEIVGAFRQRRRERAV